MEALYVGLAVAVVLLALAAWYFLSDGTTTTATDATGAAVPAPAPAGPTYVKKPGLDQFASDLHQFSTMEEAKAYCDQTPECVAYNSAGYAKKGVKSLTPNAHVDIYVKQ